jgi:hypothetical protein
MSDRAVFGSPEKIKRPTGNRIEKKAVLFSKNYV